MKKLILKFITPFRMRVLNTYLIKTIAVTFGMALLIFSFALLMGSFVQIFQLILKKISVEVILQVLFFTFPKIICYSLPFSMAAATLLVFSRLSADGEVTAMKATGISVFKIAMPCIVFSIMVGFVAVYFYNNILPKAHFTQKKIVRSLDVTDPGALIETGNWMAFDRYRLRIDEKDGNIYRKISITETLDDGRFRNMHAERGFVKNVRKQNKILLELYDVVTEERSPENSNSFIRIKGGKVDMYVDLSKHLKEKSSEINKKIADHTTDELNNKINSFGKEIKIIATQHKNDVAGILAKHKNAKKMWAKLQKMKHWKKALKSLKKKPRKAFEDIVAKQRLSFYEAKLIEIEGENGETARKLKEWHKNWMPVNMIDNYLLYGSKIKTEINYRYSYALASIAFAVIGIPLGIRAHRSEKTIGFLICIALIAVHYALSIAVQAFDEIYLIRPDLLIWIPDLLFVGAGWYFLWRIHRYS